MDAIPASWKGDSISDGKGLSGDIRVSEVDDGKGGIKQIVSVKFKYAFRPKGQTSTFFQCGTYPTNDLSTIRSNRDNAKALVAAGIDPRTKKVADKIEKQATVNEVIATASRETIQNLTVNALFDVWIVDGVKRKDGNKGLNQSFNKHVLPSIGKIPLKSLEHHHLSSLYKSIVATGKNRTSVMVASDITQMLVWAEKRKPYRALMIDGNPAMLVNMAPILPYDYTNLRDRVLSIDEIRKLKSIFDESGNAYSNAPDKYDIDRPLKKKVQLAMWLCLGTLSRIGELLMTEWQHVNFETRMWHIPKGNTKGTKDKQQDQEVYLSNFTLMQ
ncbi:MAG: integrase arm-type DNA-binding domain-containing protein, partial [Candidatus Nitrotoga sp.]